LRPRVALIEIDVDVIWAKDTDLPQVAGRRLAVEIRLSLWDPIHTRGPPALGKVSGRKDLERSLLLRCG